MTTEQQNIAIAEACGWKKVYEDSIGALWRLGDSGDDLLTVELPNYTTDLNAMHEAETTLTPTEQQELVERLADITDVPITHDIGGWGDFCAFPIIHATAAQRAEAFLCVISQRKVIP